MLKDLKNNATQYIKVTKQISLYQMEWTFFILKNVYDVLYCGFGSHCINLKRYILQIKQNNAIM